jgi:hypothetical protein
MKTSRLGSLAALLIIILLMAQLLPATVPAVPRYFDSNPSPESLQVHSTSLQNAVPLLDNNSARSAFQKTAERKCDGGGAPCEAVPLIRTEAVGQSLIADVRSTIREKIPPYFNGSKYRAGHLNA